MNGYYVTVLRGARTGWLLGPYDDHGRALANVGRARAEAERIDPWTGFDAFGTTKVTTCGNHPLPAGKLNDRIGLEEEDNGAVHGGS